MRISFLMSEADFAAGLAHVNARLAVRLPPLAWSKPLLLALCACTGLFLASWFHTPASRWGGLPSWLCSTGLWAVGMIAAGCGYAAYITQRTHALLRTSLAPFPIATDVELQADGVATWSALGSSVYLWRMIDAIGHTGSYVFVLMKNGLCLPIPSAAFASEADLQHFVQRARAACAAPPDA